MTRKPASTPTNPPTLPLDLAGIADHAATVVAAALARATNSGFERESNELSDTLEALHTVRA